MSGVVQVSNFKGRHQHCITACRIVSLPAHASFACLTEYAAELQRAVGQPWVR